MVFQDPYSSLNPRMTCGADRRRAAARCTGSCARRELDGRVARAVRHGRPAAGAAAPLPARALGRPAAARRPRARALGVAVAADRGRARVGARRLGAGGDPQPAARPPARPRLLVPLHHARPRDGRVPLRPRRGDVPRQDRRAGADRGAVRGAAAPVHAGAALGGGRRPTRWCSARGRGSCSRATCPARSRRRRAAASARAARSSASRRRGRSRRSRRCGSVGEATSSRATSSAPARRDAASVARPRGGARHDVHDPARAPGQLRHGRLDALARHRGRDGGARARRQRVRRGRRDRVHAPGRRAAPERPRRRPARRLLVGGARRAARALRAGRRARRGDDRALPRARATSSCPGTGLLAACVPGAFGGWLRLLREFGTWRLEDVLAFAIGYAEHGYPVVPGIPLTIARAEPLLRGWPGSAALYLPAPEPGSLFRNPALAATYRRIVDESRGGSREEEIERARVALLRGLRRRGDRPLLGARTAGCSTGDDLARLAGDGRGAGRRTTSAG